MLAAIAQWDEAILMALQSLHGSFVDGLWIAYTHLGDAGILWIVLSVVLLLSPKTRKAGFLSLLAMGLGLLCTNGIIKHVVARPRPYVVLERLIPLVTSGDPNSFPSGHTSAAFSAAIVWARTLPWKWGRVAAIVAAILMGFSRLYVGVHFPSDVLAGALLGSLYAGVILLAAGWIHRRRNPDNPT